jgi:hypothetical protein
LRNKGERNDDDSSLSDDGAAAKQRCDRKKVGVSAPLVQKDKKEDRNMSKALPRRVGGFGFVTDASSSSLAVGVMSTEDLRAGHGPVPSPLPLTPVAATKPHTPDTNPLAPPSRMTL